MKFLYFFVAHQKQILFIESAKYISFFSTAQFRFQWVASCRCSLWRPSVRFFLEHQVNSNLNFLSSTEYVAKLMMSNFCIWNLDVGFQFRNFYKKTFLYLRLKVYLHYKILAATSKTKFKRNHGWKSFWVVVTKPQVAWTGRNYQQPSLLLMKAFVLFMTKVQKVPSCMSSKRVSCGGRRGGGGGWETLMY